jgi:hypothetical protein
VGNTTDVLFGNATDGSNTTATETVDDSYVVGERTALVAIYNFLGGEFWDNNTGWPDYVNDNSTTDANNLFGVVVDVDFGIPSLGDRGEFVAELNLDSNSLTGECLDAVCLFLVTHSSIHAWRLYT